MVGGVLLVLVPLDINVLVMVVIRVLLQPCQVCAFAHFYADCGCRLKDQNQNGRFPKLLFSNGIAMQ